MLFLRFQRCPFSLTPGWGALTLAAGCRAVDLAIIGLPQSGKTALFKALAADHGGEEQRLAAERQEHVAVVKVPDQRLERLADMVQPKKVTPAELRLHDLPAPLQRGVALAPEHASILAGADALVHVVRAFRRPDVPHPQGSVDPHRDIGAMDLELVFHDLAIVERRLERLEMVVRSARPGEREAGERELRPLRRVREYLEQEQPLRNQPVTPEEMKQLANYGLLTLKPVLLVINIDEADVSTTPVIEADIRARYAAVRIGVAAVCARLEADLAELSLEEAIQFRQELGAAEPAAQRILALAYDVLGFVTFYTVVGDECRAWPVPAGSTALAAAGKIHSDMERGFIRAEAIAYDALLAAGSLAEARKHGLLRTEGKQYVVQDGDVLHILFHV